MGTRFVTYTEIPPRARGRALALGLCLSHAGNTPACAGKSLLARSRARRTQEIPPRARGRGPPRSRQPGPQGNTPACAGKSTSTNKRQHCHRKYPRVRGEERWNNRRLHELREIPPRARGRVSVSGIDRCVAGNTPACAGKRRTSRRMSFTSRKYPRVRGEERLSARVDLTPSEIPPRARGRVISSFAQLENPGNTPACAGKSVVRSCSD